MIKVTDSVMFDLFRHVNGYPRVRAAGEESGVINEGRPEGRVLVLVQNQGNRQQLISQLGRMFKVIEGSNGPLPMDGFDLAIVDGPAFRHSRALLGKAKESEQPVFRIN